jgi:hypothetical protein
MKSPFSVADKYLTKPSAGSRERHHIAVDSNFRASVVQQIEDSVGNLRAVKIYSAILDDRLWVLVDKTYRPTDDDPVYYDDELPLVKNKSIEHLKLIQETKKVFPGCRIVQG